MHTFYFPSIVFFAPAGGARQLQRSLQPWEWCASWFSRSRAASSLAGRMQAWACSASGARAWLYANHGFVGLLHCQTVGAGV